MGEVAASKRLTLPLDAPLGGRLQALEAATTAFAQLRAVERLASVAAAAARDGLDAELLVVAILEPDGRHLRTAYAEGLRGEARQRLTSIPLDGSSLIAQVARSGKPVHQGAGAAP